MKSLWADHDVVLVWVRHFGCLFCREQAAELRGAIPAIRACDAELVVIGSGTPEQARCFREDLQLEGVGVYSDTSKASYAAAGMKRGWIQTYHPKAALHLARALRSGARNRRIQGDPLQQGGVLVVARGGEIRYAFTSDVAGDHPPVADLLAALPRSARASTVAASATSTR